METERLKKLVKDHLGNQYQAAVNQKRVELKAGFEEEIREIRRTGRDSMGNLEAARRKYYAALETLEKEGVPGFDFESAGETAVSEIFTQQMAGEYRKEVFSLKPGDREGLQAIKNKYQSQGLDVDRVGLYSEVIR